MSTDNEIKAHSKENLKALQAYCFENKIKVPWDKVLAVGIYQDLKSLLPQGFLTSKQLFNAIGHHVNSPAYLKRLLKGTQRYGIGYKANGQVTAKEANAAKSQFFKLHAKPKQKPQPKSAATVTTRKPVTTGHTPHPVTANTLTLKGRR